MLQRATIDVRISGALAPNSANALATAQAPFSLAYRKTLTQGTITDKANLGLFVSANASTGGTDFDLSGALTDALGDAFVAVEIVGIYLRNKSTVAAELLLLGGDAAALAAIFGAANDVVKVGADGFVFSFNPSDPAFVVTPGTADILQVASASGTPAYDLCVLARNA